jgi:ketosteroid isomerase-like protein
MGESENLQAAKDGYAAFSAGDLEKAMENISDDIEWVVPGNLSVSGTKKGKDEVLQWWGQLGEKGATAEPQHWFADGDLVAMFGKTSLDGNSADTADLLTYDSDGKLIKFQSAGGEPQLYGAFGG